MKERLNKIIQDVFQIGDNRSMLKSNYEKFFPLVGFLSSAQKEELEKKLGITIKNIAIFEQALLHRSYLQIITNVRAYSNERLEFLGDSILGMIVAEFLFSEHNLLEGELTKMRSWLVNKKSLALCGYALELNSYIMMSYSAEKALENGSLSIISDAMEAIIAAIYLDSGIREVRNFILKKLLPVLKNEHIMKDTNFKSKLLEKVQSDGFDFPVYKVLEESGPDHSKEFLVAVYVNEKLIATGNGRSKKNAEQAAAKNAIEEITNSVNK